MSGIEPAGVSATTCLDRGRLAQELARAVTGEVRFDEGLRALYANDASIYRQVSTGVMLPRDADDVAAALAVCRERGAGVFGRGCGTGLAGESVNEAVLFDFSKYMHDIVDIDPRQRTARCNPESSVTSCAMRRASTG